MTKHLFAITGIVLFICLFVIFPYLPGEYDNTAAIFSIYAQVVSFLGLILVPIGIAWLINEAILYRAKRKDLTKYHFYFSRFTIFTLYIIFIVSTLIVFINNHLSIAIIAIILSAFFLKRTLSLLRTRQVSVFHSFSAIPFYLVCVPLLIFLLRSVFLEGLVTSSRSYAIYNAGPLIRDIEGYKMKKGFYPNSLLSVVKDYKTNVRGIPLYHYEPAGEAYNLYFEQNSDKFGIREIVMYNKLDQQEMTSHDQDLLLLSENELRQQRGYLKAQRLPDLHWKYFWFD